MNMKVDQFVDRKRPIASLSYLERYHYLIRYLTRQGVGRLIGVHWSFWVQNKVNEKDDLTGM